MGIWETGDWIRDEMDFDFPSLTLNHPLNAPNRKKEIRRRKKKKKKKSAHSAITVPPSDYLRLILSAYPSLSKPIQA